MTTDLRTVIRDKVAEAIYHAHRPYKSLGDDENAFIYRQSAEAAIAAYLEALGGLTQQWGVAVENDPDAPIPYFQSEDCRSDAALDAEDLAGGYVVTRYVTEWTRDD